MRISDWSSDVCSSDLGVPDLEEIHHPPEEGEIGDAGFETGKSRQDEAAAAVEGHCLRRARAAPLDVVIDLAVGVCMRQFPRREPFLEFGQDRKSTRLHSSHYCASRMPSSA